MSDAAPIESPCILVCVIDPKTGWCFGCGRTGAEIAEWRDMAPDTRREVMAALPDRTARIERPARRVTRRRRLRGDAWDGGS